MKQGWITDINGTSRHYVNDKLHNDDGPAIVYSEGTTAWYKYGVCHREDGPAVEYSNGSKYYYYNDILLFFNNNEEFLNYIKWKVFR